MPSFPPYDTASLGEHPPLNMRGLPFIVCGSISDDTGHKTVKALHIYFPILGLLVSLGLPSIPVSEESDRPSEYIQAPVPPEEFSQVAVPPEHFLHVPIHPDIVGKDDFEHEETSTSQ